MRFAAAALKQARRVWPARGFTAFPAMHNGAQIQCVAGPQILRTVNKVGELVHHGKSIESCLLLLDLSRFLKL
jgi:hypothetical protein